MKVDECGWKQMTVDESGWNIRGATCISDAIFTFWRRWLMPWMPWTRRRKKLAKIWLKLLVHFGKFWYIFVKLLYFSSGKRLPMPMPWTGRIDRHRFNLDFWKVLYLFFVEKFDNFKGSGLIATHMVDWRCVKKGKIHRIKTRTRNQTARKAIWTRGQFDRICMSCLYTWFDFKCNCICIHICISSVYNDLNTCIYISCLYTCLYFKHICILWWYLYLKCGCVFSDICILGVVGFVCLVCISICIYIWVELECISSLWRALNWMRKYQALALHPPLKRTLLDSVNV